MKELLVALDLSSVALSPACRDLESDLRLSCERIEEIDFFGVGDRIDSLRLGDFAARWTAGICRGRQVQVAAVNGPYRVSYPSEPTLVMHVTLWPRKWLTRVCPFVVNGFREAGVAVGVDPETLVGPRRPHPRELLSWHYGLENCLRYVRRERFDAPTWWVDGRPGDGKMAAHDLADPYRMTEFIAYALNGALCNIAHFPDLVPASADRAVSLAAEFRRTAVAARNGVPVEPAFLAQGKPEALSVLEKLRDDIRTLL